MTTIDALPHWHDEPDVYDALFLGGQRIPGVVKVEIARKVKIDKKSPKGKHKAVVTKQGVEAAEITIEIRVLEPEDVETLRGQMDLLEPVPDKEKATAEDALDISHWTTAWRRIEAIVIEETKGPELVDGVLILTIKAVEFDKPKPAPIGQGGGGGGGVLYIGTFVRIDNTVIPRSLVCLQEGVATVDAYGQPINKPGPYHYWKQLAFAEEAGTITEQPGAFIGKFIAPDEPLRLAWEEKKKTEAAPKDATSTPKKSTGSTSLDEFDKGLTAPPDPATTDTGP